MVIKTAIAPIICMMLTQKVAQAIARKLLNIIDKSCSLIYNENVLGRDVN